jgi:chaperonin GroES
MNESSKKIGSLGRIGDARLDLVPEVADCNPGIKPVEYNVVIAPARAPDKVGAQGLIIAPDEFKDNSALAMQVGRIVRASPLAFTYDNWPEGSQAPRVGDVVWFARYAGKEFEGADGQTYRILKDKDIGAVIEETAAAIPMLKEVING